ncbi:MAG: ATP-binding cassette domain-containing protein [Nitrospirae bacterium]|uniref:ABC transporter ATP-binding protein n=1 Tax=Candidatus Magnetominusculus dajiuhuensis TaxID=3137712 RepID=UPI0019F3F3D9|nr:ATP-binding cassette domain-containing protein [Nitrospirota bacterium]
MKKSIALENISMKFYRDGNEKCVLDGVSMTLTEDRFASLVGPNGSGKSTLMNIIARIMDYENDDTGKIIYNGFQSEKKIGYVWQNYKDSLLPWLTVEENIAFPIYVSPRSSSDGKELARKLIGTFLPDISPKAMIYQLSGGQQQMVCLLRALVLEPDIMLLDEPFAALDQQRSWTTALHFEKEWSKRQIPVLFVSHDVDAAVLLSDDIGLLSKKNRKITKCINNTLEHPRTLDMLTAKEHILCRKEIIEFLHSES